MQKNPYFAFSTKFMLVCLISIGLLSCSPTKHIADGQYLLDKVEIKSDAKEVDKNELPDFIRQMPNSKILGIFRMQLGIYNLSGNDTTKRANRILRRMGQKPVVVDSMLTDNSSHQLLRYHINKGYFNAEINTTVHKKNKRAKVVYEIKSHKPYRIDEYEVEITQPVLKRMAEDSTRSLIQKDMLFDVYQLDKERDRLSSGLRRQGYYNFMKDYLAYSADSVGHEVDVSLHLRDYLSNQPDSLEQGIFKKYYISKVVYNLTPAVSTALSDEFVENDTIWVDDYVLIGPKSKFLTFSALKASTSIRPGSLYSDAAVERTYAAFNALPPVKYTHISFTESAPDSLQCLITVAQAKTFTFSSQAEITFTEGYWGTAGNIGLMHRNLFKGAEALTVQGRYALEKQGDLMAQEWGGQIGLRVPRILIPFANEDFIRRLNGFTEFKTSLSYQYRPAEFASTNVGIGTKYSWRRRRDQHTFDLLDLSYVHFPWRSTEFVNTFLEPGNEKYNPHNYEDYLVMRIGYGKSSSGYNQQRPLHNYLSYRYSIETAGNTLYGIYKLFNLPADAENTYRTFNIRFSQYARGEINTSYHQIIDKNNKFVYHAGLGVGYPYGNADIIPFERRFYSGGANSVRGWGESQLGPGSYKRIVSNRRDYNQVGDIKLDMNLEYRAKMFWVLEGALFVDAGNIWTVRDYPNQSGGVFQFDSFWKEIALAYGFGIRMDFSFFLFRMDLGFKLYDPAISKWRTPDSFKNMAFHIAIGYPF